MFSPRVNRARAATRAAIADMDEATARAMAERFAADEAEESARSGPSSPDPSVGGSPAHTPPRRIPLQREEGSRTPEGTPIATTTRATPLGKSPSRSLSPRKYIVTKYP